MSETDRNRARLWLRGLLAIAALFLAALMAVAGFFWSGMADSYLRRTIVNAIDKATGGRAELARFHFDPLRLRVTLEEFTIHGREPEGAPPFLHIDRLEVGVRVDSFWGHKFSVGEVLIERPQIDVILAKDGSSNVPIPPGQRNGKPIRQRLFEVVVRQLRLDHGELIFNDQKIPLEVQGGLFDFAVDYSDLLGRRMYMGDFEWKRMVLAARNFRAFPSDIGVRFTFEPDALAITQLLWTAPHTNVDAQITIPSLTHPTFDFRYRGKLGLEDIQTILRKPTAPAGQVEFNGNGHFGDGKLAVTGGYAASGITLRDKWFHTGGMTSRSNYVADKNHLELPAFTCTGMGGFVTGHLLLQFHGMHFRVDAHAQKMALAAVLGAVNNDNFPVNTLHWDSSVDVQSVVTWINDFKQVDSTGVALWTPGSQARNGQIPVSARLNYHYNMLKNSVALEASEIATPSSRLQFEGTLAKFGSGLNATFDTSDLRDWDDFINRLRGENVPPKLIAGNFHWQGMMRGPIVGPTFAGHARGTAARYDQLLWDEIEGNMQYSPDGFSFTRASARRGRSSAQLELSMTLDNWNFRPASPWSFDATLVRTDMEGLQSLLGFSLPVSGLLSGTFHGSGTRADPTLNALFDVISPEAWGWKFDRARGEFSLKHGEVRVANAELRLLPPPSEQSNLAPAAPGLITANFVYNTVAQEANFSVTGASVPLEGVSHLQTPRLPVGGRLSFQLSGAGPLLAPKVQGTMRVVDLRLSSTVVGSFAAQINADGRDLNVQVDSAMPSGSLHGSAKVALRGDYPMTSEVNFAQIDLDPLIAAVLHLTGFTGRGQADGRVTIAGDLKNSETLNVQANLSRINFDFQYVKLENEGPVRLEYGHHEVRVDQATLRGLDTDFHLAGFARFAGDRRLEMQVGGQVNLGLLSGFIPNLQARGPAQVDAGIAGTMSNPRITGRVRLQNAGVRYGDFPTGLTNVAGDIVFDATRLVFDNLTAQTGGGNLRLSGSLSYGGGPLRYDLTARSDQVRIRYPIGMSWLVGGTLQMTGTSQAASLTGRATVDRLLLSDNFDLASLMVSSSEPVSAPSTSSPFLRNLQFDVQATSSPNARVEWASGNSQSEANLRIRGTWEHPILLGNIRLLSGDMQFRGNRYTLARGEINFVNPFRLDPVLDIEATTRIREYLVTVDFDGPASHLTMSYRSDPPLPSNDVVTLLALGQSGENTQLRGVTAVQTPEVGATTLLSEAISSQLGGRVERLFGISRFSLDPASLEYTTAGQNPAARVTIQQEFARSLVIIYSTDVTSTQQQVIQIEYTIRPDLSVVALRDENGTFGIDIVRKKRFK